MNKHRIIADGLTQFLYIDVNNLYGCALSQKLPCGDFQWPRGEGEIDHVMALIRYGGDLDQERGYVSEVDIEIPAEIYDKLDQFPIAPETKSLPGNNVKKHLLTHEPKINYVVHGKLLQMYVKLGALVTKAHRIVSFKQAPIFAEYIDYNTKMRALVKCEFVRNFYKLKCNSLYGKTVENLMKRLNLRLCNNVKKLVTYTSKARFRRSSQIDQDLVAVLDIPSYIGQVVLDLSKLLMYQLHYEELQVYREKFACEINIFAGDIDSFFLV